jgi:hypothetical protein
MMYRRAGNQITRHNQLYRRVGNRVECRNRLYRWGLLHVYPSPVADFRFFLPSSKTEKGPGRLLFGVKYSKFCST